MVLDLDENFRPDIVSRSGTVVSVDTEKKTVKVKLPKSEKSDDVNLSKRASIFHEAIAITAAGNETADSTIEMFEEREFKIDDLFDVKVVEAPET